jgi:hypothetical protein
LIVVNNIGYDEWLNSLLVLFIYACLRNLLVVLVASLISVVALADPLSQTKHQRICGLAVSRVRTR